MTEKLRRAWRGFSPLVKVILALAVGACATLAYAYQDDENEGTPGAFEIFFGLNTVTNDAAFDIDGDGLDNLSEVALWTDPFKVDTDRDGLPDGMDGNPVSRAVMPWGDAFFTRTNETVYTWPVWLVAAFKFGGEWETNIPAWWVPASETGLAYLNIELDRSLLTNDLWLRLPLGAGPNASLFLDLYDTNECVIASNLCGGNLLADIGTGSVKTLSVPLESYADAVGIRLRRDAGAVTIGETLAYVDRDGDGLDDDQERQLETPDCQMDDAGDDDNKYFSESYTNSPGSGRDDYSPAIGNDDGNDKKNRQEYDEGESGVIYVDQTKGNDTFTGRAAYTSASKGPKKTIRGGLSVAATTNEVMIIKSGDYHENLNIQGRNVKVLIEGNVRL